MPHHNSSIAERTTEYRQSLLRHIRSFGLTIAEFVILLDDELAHRSHVSDSRRSTLVDCLQEFLETGDSVDIRTLRILAPYVDRVLGLELTEAVPLTPTEKLYQRARSTFIMLLFLFVVYMVGVGVATGHSALLKDAGPFASIFILVLLIVILGALEGLQMSVAILRMRHIPETHNLYYKLIEPHGSVASTANTNRFLGGR